MRLLLDLLYRLRRQVWRVLRLHRRGVKVMPVDEAGALLFRNNYVAERLGERRTGEQFAPFHDPGDIWELSRDDWSPAGNASDPA